MAAIINNLQAIRAAIAAAAKRAGRVPDAVQLLAVSKTFPPQAIREAYAGGQTAFGENYVQEALEKIAELHELPLVWHFIGPIQSNKTRAIAEHFSWVHGVDRLKIAQRLSEQRPANLPPLNVCVEVNVSNEPSKSGVAPEEAAQIARQIAALPRLKLRGLMTIPAPADDEAVQRQPFARLHRLLHELNAQGLKLDTLSMGMSHDFAAAITEGSTLVRIGTAIFGTRNHGEKK